MRILVVHNRYRSAQPSGEDVIVDREVAGLRASGHVVDTYVRESDEIASFGLAQKLALPGRVVWSPEDARRLSQLIEETAPQVVHVHNTFPLISPAAVGVARRHGVPVVATLHNFRLVCAAGTLVRDGTSCTTCVTRGPVAGLVHGCYRGSRVATLPVVAGTVAHRLRRTWTNEVDRLLVMTRFARDLLVRAGLPADRLVVKPHGVDEAPQRRTGAGEGLLCAGRLSSEKGFDILLRAWAPEVGPVTVIGDGPLRSELERSAETLGADVSFVGQLPHEEVRRRMAEARAVVVPSRAFETFGLSAVEAMSAGVPVVVPDHGALGEVVAGGRGGLSYRPGDHRDLRRALLAVKDPVAALELGASARALYEERYTMDRSLRALEATYEELVA